MSNALDFPIVVFCASLLILWLSVWVGMALPKRYQGVEGVRDDFTVILGASLTLLGLIIGFTFSMAVGRYDQRKNLEEEEANAIGTEYARADLLPPADAAKLRVLLRQYLDQRVLFYELGTRQGPRLEQIDHTTAQLQAQLWTEVVAGAETRPAVMTLAISGMNDVLNSQGYTQAAWWNRIPTAAWLLMGSIAVFCNLLTGYSAHHKGEKLMLVLPLMVSLSFLLIADIDSPRGGVIRVLPRNLTSLAQSLQAH